MKKLLVVVDYQNDFVTGSLGSEQALAVCSAICSRIAAARQEGTDVCFTLDTHGPDYMQTTEGKYLPVPHCLKNSEGWQLYPAVAALVQDGDTFVEKETFGSEKLYELIKEAGYTHVELCGVVTDICVISNAVVVRTANPMAEITVYKDAVATTDEAKQQAALEVMASLQIQIK